MKTIPRNHTKKIAAIKATIVKVEFYDQHAGVLKPTTLEAAFEDLYRYDFSKLYVNDEGTKYTVHVHSNLWYYLHTQAALDNATAKTEAADTRGARMAARRSDSQQQRDARTAAHRQQWQDAANALDQRPADEPAPITVTRTRMAIATPTREQRNAATIARTTSIHDLGKPATVPARTLHVRDRRDNLLYVFEGIEGWAVWLSDPADATRHAEWVTLGEFRKYFEASCENGNNHLIETCPGCGTEDAEGNQVEEPIPAPAVTVTRTRMAIGDQISQACTALGIKLGHGWNKGTATFLVKGRDYTAGELADLVLEGGFGANYGGNEVRVNWDSSLVTPKNPEQRMGRAVMAVRDAQDRVPASVARRLDETAQALLDLLHGWAIEDAPRPRVDFPSGAAEPGREVAAVRCVRTGLVFERDGITWRNVSDDTTCNWYRLNETDPMSEGFQIYRKEA